MAGRDPVEDLEADDGQKDAERAEGQRAQDRFSEGLSVPGNRGWGCLSEQLHEEGANLRVTYRDRYWSFPREECALLPIANTTAELLADYIAGCLRERLIARGFALPRVLRVEVEESFGQSAEVEWIRDDEPSLST